MNIEVTEDEYGKLLEMVYMAEWVLTAHKQPDERMEHYTQIIQKLYARARDTAYAEMVTYDEDLEKYLPARRLEEDSEARRLLDQFADETFWHELIYRFTQRDAETRAGGSERFMSLPPDKRFDMETPIEEKYIEEFEKYGIERLEIVEQFGPDTGVKTSD